MKYSDEVLRRVRDPQRAGSLAGGRVGTGEVGTLDEGTVMRIQVRADGDRITEARFKVFGCSAAIASASLVVEWLEGAAMHEAGLVTTERVVQALDLAPERAHVARMAVEAAQLALGDVRRQKAEMIEITDSAARVIEKQLVKQQKSGGGLRIAVKAGGCSGFSYVFAFDDAPRATDAVFEGANGAKVFIDPRSLKLLDGTVLDFDEHNLMATGFTLKNPHAKSTCGCGESFSA